MIKLCSNKAVSNAVLKSCRNKFNSAQLKHDIGTTWFQTSSLITYLVNVERECRIMTHVLFVKHLPIQINASTMFGIGNDKILLKLLLANYDINHIVQITFRPCCFPSFLRLFSTALRSRIFRFFSSSSNDSRSSSTYDFSPNSARDEQFELMSVPSFRPSEQESFSASETIPGRTSGRDLLNAARNSFYAHASQSQETGLSTFIMYLYFIYLVRHGNSTLFETMPC